MEGSDSSFSVERDLKEGADEDFGVAELEMNAEDVRLVVAQVGCTPAQAALALHQHNNDIVDAIFPLVQLFLHWLVPFKLHPPIQSGSG